MPESVHQIVNERIAILLGLAEKNAKGHPKRSRRYVELARKLAMRYRIRLGKLKRKFCRKCNRFWVPGFNVKVRLVPRKGKVLYECECGSKAYLIYKGAGRQA
jgi:ribonuclease P protein subunit RPR2